MLCKPDTGKKSRFQNIERSECRPAFRETALVSFSKGGAPMRQEFDVSPFQYSAEEVLREAGYEK